MKRLVQFILKLLARAYIRRFRPKIIAITGSVGKTSTKEAIRLALEKSFRVRASAKSYNNEIGVPLTILGYKSPAKNIFVWLWIFCRSFLGLFWQRNYPEILVLEMGSDKPGDLKYLVSIAKPHISVITRIGPAHYAAFEDMEKLIEEKGTLVKVLNSEDWAVLNYDDEVLRELGLRAPCRVRYYGINNEADVKAGDLKMEDSGLAFKIDFEGRTYSLKLEAAGKHFVYIVLAAFAVGTILNIEPSLLAQRLSQFQPLPGRGRILKGKKQTLLIDETYNANPLSMQAALNFVKRMNWPKRKVLVLGDMRELGSLSRKEHQKLGKTTDFADLVIFVGEEIKPAFEIRARKGLPCFYYEGVSDLISDLEKIIRPGDLVLFKGSQAVRLEKAVATLLAPEYNPKEVLVRQGSEWNKK